MSEAKPMKSDKHAKGNRGMTVLQAILLGTVLAVIINGYRVFEEGYRATAVRLLAHNHAAMVALAKRNLTIASLLMGAGVGASLLPHEMGHALSREFAKLGKSPSLNILKQSDYGQLALESVGAIKKGATLIKLTFIGVVIKAVSLLASVGVLLVAVILGIIDGLCQRYVRTVEGGRESTYVYHKANATSRRLPGFVLVLYVLLPLPVSPELAMLVLALLVFVLVRTSAGLFKKYV